MMNDKKGCSQCSPGKEQFTGILDILERIFLQLGGSTDELKKIKHARNLKDIHFSR